MALARLPIIRKNPILFTYFKFSKYWICINSLKFTFQDYDYAYDYSEMTIKPQNGTTSTTKKPLTTETVTQIDKDNATLSLADYELTTKIIEKNESITGNAVTTDSASYSSSTTVATTTLRREGMINNTITTSESNNATALSDCKKGFFRNSKGNCELKLQNPSNM